MFCMNNYGEFQAELKVLCSLKTFHFLHLTKVPTFPAEKLTNIQSIEYERQEWRIQEMIKWSDMSQ